MYGGGSCAERFTILIEDVLFGHRNEFGVKMVTDYMTTHGYVVTTVQTSTWITWMYSCMLEFNVTLNDYCLYSPIIEHIQYYIGLMYLPTGHGSLFKFDLSNNNSQPSNLFRASQLHVKLNFFSSPFNFYIIFDFVKTKTLNIVFGMCHVSLL